MRRRLSPLGQKIFFALIVALVAGIAYWDFQRGQEQESATAIKDRVFPALEGSRLDQVIFDMAGQERVELRAVEGNWRLSQPLSDEGDDWAIDQFLLDLLRQDVYVVEVKGEVDWSQYGLDPPQGTFYLKTRDGKEYQVEIAGEPSFDGRYYLRRGNQLLIGHQRWGSLVKTEWATFRNKRLLPEGTKIKSIQFTSHGNSVFKLDRRGDKWETEGEDLENPLVKAFVRNQIVEARITHFVEEDKGNLSKYKLDKPFGKLVMEKKTGDPSTFEWTFTDPSQDLVFMQSSFKPGIYRISPVLAQQWIKSPSDFRSEEEQEGQNGK